MQIDKNRIKAALVAYTQRYKSAKEASVSIGVSNATVSQVLNNNWELISDEMWRKIAAGINYTDKVWNVGVTSVYAKLSSFFAEAQHHPKGIDAFVINSSLGKSIAVDDYCANHTNAYHIRCHRFMSVRTLFKEILKAMGKDSSGTTMDMLDNMVGYLERDNHPLLIIDEADKLKDEVLEMFVDIENKLHHKCGIVFLATPYLKKRIEQSVSRNKRGFAELYSRAKKVFWDLTPSKKEFVRDVKIICHANGVTDEAVIAEFTNKCENDFRVLTDLITAHLTNQAEG
jgi:DNA transposition AAA+ family ATPase